MVAISLEPGNIKYGDSSAGMQALPVGKIIEVKVIRKDNQEIVPTCMSKK